MMKYNPDSRLFRLLNSLTTVLCLAVSLLVVSLPIVTIGVSFIAGFRVLSSSPFPAYPLRTFWYEVRTHLKQGILVSLFFEAFIVLLGFSSYFWFHQHLWFAFIIALVGVLIVAYLIQSFIFTANLCAIYSGPTNQMIKSALMFPFITPLISLALLIVPILLINVALMLPIIRPILLIFGLLLCCRIWASLITKALQRYNQRISKLLDFKQGSSND